MVHTRLACYDQTYTYFFNCKHLDFFLFFNHGCTSVHTDGGGGFQWQVWTANRRVRPINEAPSGSSASSAPLPPHLLTRSLAQLCEESCQKNTPPSPPSPPPLIRAGSSPPPRPPLSKLSMLRLPVLLRACCPRWRQTSSDFFMSWHSAAQDPSGLLQHHVPPTLRDSVHAWSHRLREICDGCRSAGFFSFSFCCTLFPCWHPATKSSTTLQNKVNVLQLQPHLPLCARLSAWLDVYYNWRLIHRFLSAVNR